MIREPFSGASVEPARQCLVTRLVACSFSCCFFLFCPRLTKSRLWRNQQAKQKGCPLQDLLAPESLTTLRPSSFAPSSTPGDSWGHQSCPARRSAAAGSSFRTLSPGHVSLLPWSGVSALLGEGAGAPQHPGAGRSAQPDLLRRKHLQCSPRPAARVAGRCQGEPRG